MEIKKFTYLRRDGSVHPPVRLIWVMAAAANRIIWGRGPYLVIRNGEYRHPDLNRSEALRRLRGILSKIGVGANAAVWRPNAKTEERKNDQERIFLAKRVKFSVYDNPFRNAAGVQGLRQDMGVDYSVTQDSPVYAIGPGVVTVYRTYSGWPKDASHSEGGSYIAYKLTEGPAEGKFVYWAENITLNGNLRVGSKVETDTRLGTQHPGFANCEMGWASASSNGYSPVAYGCYSEGDRTAAGDNFDKFMRELGAPAGLTEGRSIRCSLPAGYPSSWTGKV